MLKWWVNSKSSNKNTDYISWRWSDSLISSLRNSYLPLTIMIYWHLYGTNWLKSYLTSLNIPNTDSAYWSWSRKVVSTHLGSTRKKRKPIYSWSMHSFWDSFSLKEIQASLPLWNWWIDAKHSWKNFLVTHSRTKTLFRCWQIRKTNLWCC